MGFNIKELHSNCGVIYKEILQTVLEQILCLVNNSQGSAVQSLVAFTDKAIKLGDTALTKLRNLETPAQKTVALFAAIEDVAISSKNGEIRRKFLELLLNFDAISELRENIQIVISINFCKDIEIIHDSVAGREIYLGVENQVGKINNLGPVELLQPLIELTEANTESSDMSLDVQDQNCTEISVGFCQENLKPGAETKESVNQIQTNSRMTFDGVPYALTDCMNSLKGTNPRITTCLTIILCCLTLCFAMLCILTITRHAGQQQLPTNQNLAKSFNVPVQIFSSDHWQAVMHHRANGVGLFRNTEHLGKGLRHLELPNRPRDEKEFWMEFPAHVTTEKLKISVAQNPANLGAGVELTNDLNTVIITGRPLFCTEATFVDDIKGHVFQKVTHLQISEVEDCYNFLNLILNFWTFPKIRVLSFNRIAIQRPEFLGIMKFIDRHNETICKLQIDNCYLCSFPDCDTAMINTPSHPFHFQITGTRYEPDML